MISKMFKGYYLLCTIFWVTRITKILRNTGIPEKNIGMQVCERHLLKTPILALIN